MNIVGNVVGSQQQSNLTTDGTSKLPVAAFVIFPDPLSYDNLAYNFAFGYGEGSDDGTGTGCAGSTEPPCHGTQAFDTVFLHGNYTHADGAIAWSGSITHALPCSMYLSAQPAWWRGLPFPAIGPDVTGGDGPAGHAYGNPARACFAKMGGVDGGQGSPLKFNATDCYGG